MEILPQPLKYTATEASPWYPWDGRAILRHTDGIRMHAILFDNGMVFDMANGWRKDFRYCVHCGNRQC